MVRRRQDLLPICFVVASVALLVVPSASGPLGRSPTEARPSGIGSELASGGAAGLGPTPIASCALLHPWMGCASSDLSPTPLPTPAWVPRTAAISHVPVFPGTLAFDAAIGRSVEFDGLHATTWAFSGGAWANITPPVSPSPRAYAGLAYDSDAQELVLFGGAAVPSGVQLNDTWVFRGGAWTNVTSSTDPPPTALFGLASDPRENGVVLFGGNANHTLDGGTNATWLFTGSAWRQVANSGSPAPPPTFAPAMTYDSVDRVVVLFGGVVFASGKPSYSNQTWTYASGNWTNRTVAGPSPRASPSLSDDPTVGGVLLFGGAGAGITPQYRNDTWLYHGGRWSQVGLTSRAPSPRDEAGFDWDIGGAMAVLDGGVNPTGVTSEQYGTDTWTFAGDAWMEVQSNFTPAARFAEGFTGTLGAPTSALLVGGVSTSGVPLNDSWQFSRGTWVERPTTVGPPNRTEAMVANDPTDGYQVLFGGTTPAGVPSNATWTFDGTTWSNRTAGAAPSPRSNGVFVYDPLLGLDILFGGRNATNATLNDTWSYHAGVWRQVTTNASPPSRAFASGIFDPERGGIVVFGGSSDGGNPGSTMQNDTWLFANRTWSPIATTSGPSSRYGAGLDFDVRLQSVVLYGGSVFPNSPYQLNDTWVLNASGWALLSLHGSPPPVSSAAFWWDARSNTTWIYGGAAYESGNHTVVASAETEALDLLTASANTSAAAGATPFSLQLRAQAADGEAPYEYEWSVPGGSVPTANGTWTVNTAGTFTVYLNVTDSWGVVWRATFPLTVSAGPLQASFIATPNQGTAPLTVAFAATAAGGSAPYSYTWEFGDGTSAPTSGQPNASHRYLENRTFNVTLTVGSTPGGNTTVTESVILQSFAFPGVFNVTASVTPDSGPPPLNVTFSAVASNGTAPYRYAWSFGDGAASGAASGSHEFGGVGEFTVRLNVTDANSVVVNTSFLVVVRSAAPATTPSPKASTPGFAGLPWWVWGVVAAAVAVAVASLLLFGPRRGAGASPEVRYIRPKPWDETADDEP